MSNTISACIICKNEEEKIGNLLESIHDIVDEIIVVDTGSTDKTKEIVAKYTENLFDFEWIYDFAAARNYSFSKATKDWIIWLDSDDKFVEEDRIKFKKLKEETLGNTNIDVFNFWYCYRHNAEGKCTYKFYRERLIRNWKGYHWEYPVHELLLAPGVKGHTDICVTHTSNHDNGQRYIDFFDYKMEHQGYVLRQRDKYYYGGELAIFGYTDKAQAVFEDFFAMGEHDNPYETKRASEYLMDIYIKKEMYKEAWDTALKYIKYGLPDPKIYYKCGMINDKLGKKDESIFFYKIVSEMADEFPDEGCVINEFSSYIFDANLELSVKLYHTEYEKAKKYHERAKAIYPDHPSIVFNDQFFNK